MPKPRVRCVFARLVLVADPLCAVMVAGADVNARNECGWSPLHVAVENLHGWAVRLLIGAGCEVQVSDEDGETPLHIVAAKAVEDGAPAVMRLLLGAHPAIDQPKSDGYSALHVAVMSAAGPLVQLLLQAGADPNFSCPPHNHSPRELAAELCLDDSILAIFDERSAYNSRQLPALQPVLEANWDALPTLAERDTNLELTATEYVRPPFFFFFNFAIISRLLPIIDCSFIYAHTHARAIYCTALLVWSGTCQHTHRYMLRVHSRACVVHQTPSRFAPEGGQIQSGQQLTCKPEPHKADDGSIWLAVTRFGGDDEDAPTEGAPPTWICAVDPQREVPMLCWLMDGVSMLLGFKVLAPITTRFAAPLCDHTTAQVLHGIRRFFRLGADKIFLADVVGDVGSFPGTASASGGLGEMLIKIAHRSLTGLARTGMSLDAESQGGLALEAVELTVDALPHLIREGLNTYVIVTWCDHPDSLAVLEGVTVDMGDKLLLAISEQASSTATKLQMNRMGWEDHHRRPISAGIDGAEDTPTDAPPQGISRAETNLTVVREHRRRVVDGGPSVMQRWTPTAEVGQFWVSDETSGGGVGSALASPVSPCSNPDFRLGPGSSDASDDAAEDALDRGEDAISTPPDDGALLVPPDGASLSGPTSRLADMIGLDPGQASMWLDMAGGDVERALELYIEMGQGDGLHVQGERDARERGGLVT